MSSVEIAEHQETTLSKADSERLAELVEIIDRNVQGFIAVGNALVEIKRNELYCETHKTFEAFCEDRWGFGKSQANRLIASTKVVDRLVDKTGAMAPLSVLPTNERQVRELAKVNKSEQAEVWAKVIEVTDKPTAKIVKAVVKQWNKLKLAVSSTPKEPDKVSVAADTGPVKPKKEKVYRRDAPMPEWYMDDNSVAIPEGLYPAWRTKQRFFELANGPVSQETCDQLSALGQELNHPVTVELGRELWGKFSGFQLEFRRAIASGEPRVLSADKTTWLSKREVPNG